MMGELNGPPRISTSHLPSLWLHVYVSLREKGVLLKGDCPAAVPRTAGKLDIERRFSYKKRRIVAVANEKSQNVQDVFLNHVRKSKTPVTVFLVNGVKLQGIITWFDNFSVLLRRDGHTQLVYKHAISTVMPGAPIQLFDATKVEGAAAPARELSCRDRERLIATPVHQADRPAPSPASDRRRGRSRRADSRAAVILPWERQGRDVAGADQPRAAEARLAEAVGLAASIGLRRRAYGDPAVARAAAVHAAGRGPGCRPRVRRSARTMSTVAIVDAALTPGAAAQPGARLELQGHRPDRPDPGYFR